MLKKEEIQKILDAQLRHVHTSARQRQMLYENAKEGQPPKRKLSVGFVLVLVLLVMSMCAALAASGAFDALKAIWEDSFSRMNTNALLDIVDEPDVSAYLESFEDEYGAKKEDLVLSTVPGEDDLSLDEAIRIAKNTVMERFGTPEAEIDAMGIYPTYYEEPYQTGVSQWRVYITPRRNVNLDEDHDYPAPGEYLVFIDSPSGEVSDCFYYNDDFWPDYAQRCWENGSRDYVYEQAQRAGFMKQSAENIEHFMELFRVAGYDLEPFEKMQNDEIRLRSVVVDICFAQIREDLLESSDGFVLTAIQEMENRFGITREDMDRCFFSAVRNPVQSETVDICFSYNFHKQAAAAPGPCESLGTGYGTRLGYFMICIDPQTGKTVSAVNIVWNEMLLPTYKGGLLSRMHWTKEDLPEYYRMMEELRVLDAGYVAGRDSQTALLNEADQILLRYGGDPNLYTAQREDGGGYTLAQFLYENDLTEEAIFEKGREYLLSHTSYSEKELQNASFIAGTQFDNCDQPESTKIHPTLLVLLEKENGEGMRWYFQFDLDLNITDFEESENNIHG